MFVTASLCFFSLGPAIIIDKTSTIVVENECEAEITEFGDIKITIGKHAMKKVG